MPGNSFQVDMEDPSVQNIKLTLYGPKEEQTWILQELLSEMIRPETACSGGH
jgi:hypothetical protein